MSHRRCWLDLHGIDLDTASGSVQKCKQKCDRRQHVMQQQVTLVQLMAIVSFLQKVLLRLQASTA